MNEKELLKETLQRLDQYSEAFDEAVFTAIDRA